MQTVGDLKQIALLGSSACSCMAPFPGERGCYSIITGALLQPSVSTRGLNALDQAESFLGPQSARDVFKNMVVLDLPFLVELSAADIPDSYDKVLHFGPTST